MRDVVVADFVAYLRDGHFFFHEQFAGVENTDLI